jgi:hypothetical protein
MIVCLAFIGLVLIGCQSSPAPQQPQPQPKDTSNETLNKTQNMKDMGKENLDESTKKK